MGILSKNFMPNAYVQSIHEIDFDKLADNGIKGVITDLDNTLVGWDVADPTPAVIHWFNMLNEKGIKVTVVSNNHQNRVSSFCQPLKVNYIFEARKPMGKAFKHAADRMGLKPEETVVIGDQMLTDVFGGNRRGMYTVMVVPVKKTDGFVTKFNRIIERRLLNRYKRKGYIKWEEN
ncbi:MULTISPECIES: YqeG family HAD IIIA-type phosphatase [Staphylococcus]|uniref:YqeG family HAD IIIA-type phosphatase n=1 Tax=Staphylococcus TaxID=1279 RepID=UPI000DF83B72|nr:MULTISPECIES: YqeG family HAD IIIA-type phosphatase [unclassified Staphylococcus]UXV33784.1 YqeG family HAD IIIA-type phosphatase [Staphylococcus sp. IVB6181]